MSQDEAVTQLYGKADPLGTINEDNLMSYICNWNNSTSHPDSKLAPQTSRHLTTTIYQFYLMHLYLKRVGTTYIVCRSVICTLPVELLFCCIRGMQPYVTASELSTLGGRSESDQGIM
ncbi:hypothetical protein D3C80_1775370 [compost metagenome]